MQCFRIENKHSDQLWGYVAADLCLCFCKKQGFSCAAQIYNCSKVVVKLTPAELVFIEKHIDNLLGFVYA